MPMVDLSCPVQGQKTPTDHAYVLYSTVAKFEVDPSREMAAASGFRPEILSRLCMSLPQPRMHPSQDPCQPLGSEVRRFPGGNLLAEGSIKWRLRGDPQPATRSGELLVLGGQVACPLLMGQVQQHRIREVELMRVRQLQGRRRDGRIQVKQEDGAGGELQEFLRRIASIHAIDRGENVLGLEEYERRGEPARERADKLLARDGCRMPLQEAVDEEHRIQAALQRRARRRSHPRLPPRSPPSRPAAPTRW